MRSVSILTTGVSNIASVYSSFERFGVKVSITKTLEEISNAPALILPGVGSFGAGMKALRDNGFDDPLRQRIKNGLPTLCICLGMQMLCNESEESSGVIGLGIINQKVKKFPKPFRIPQFGWNQVYSDDLRYKEYAYFANSYYLPEAPTEWTCYWSNYGIPFVSMIKRGGVLATQFHPELSGEYGRKLLSNWMQEVSC